MSEYHKKLKQEIRQLKLDTIALRKIRKEKTEIQLLKRCFVSFK